MKLETNILILGKTGVGKSSFINYIYGEKKRETGTGKPVTQKGIFKESFELGELVVNIYDSWGLEADKASSWEEEIKSALIEHNDSLEIKDWFHTIYYCFSTQSARIEDFEVNNILKPLLDKNNKVCIILTHSDVIGADEKSKGMIETLKAKLPINDDDIIKVSSSGKKLLGGTFKEPFGRDAVLSKLKFNLWNDIKVKLPLNFERYLRLELKNWRLDAERVIERDVKFFNTIPAANDIINSINFRLKARFYSIDKKIEKIITDTIDYYETLFDYNSNLFSDFLHSSEEKIKNAEYKTQRVKFVYDPQHKFEYWTNIVMACFIPLFILNLSKWKLKSDLKKNVEATHYKLGFEIPQLVNQFRYALEGNLNQINFLG